ncbi:MAG: cell division protein SepF [Candidatus Melainabacteria bacterium]|nr:cell division protein SepF [Candidatus Melainabacteria bacterium]
MSILEFIKGIWYRDMKEVDVYNPQDFDELWKTEEQDSISPSHSTSHISNLTSNNFQSRGNIKVIDHPSLTPQSEVVVIEPRSFDEALDIVEELRCRRSVVLNLQYLDTEQSQRVVDFLSGATHALDGHQQRVGQGVFIFAPNNFTLSTESNEARALKDAFWGRSKEREQQKLQEQYQYAEPVKKSSIF